jgi:dolichyl-diphosphooligosaccharide--protein glycosyltransferase
VYVNVVSYDDGATVLPWLQVSAWGGSVFIINLIPLHVFTLLLMGRYSNRIFTGTVLLS